MEKQGSNPEPVTKVSADINVERIAQLYQLFPEVFTEGKVDFDKLRATLGNLVDDRPERYNFTWAGKQDAIRILQTPTSATLIPAPDESVDFNHTQNIFIEGDNLEVLKLLYKSYFGRVKVIYIDPPYNTGNDFIYPDNYTDPLNTYLRLTGQKDAEGNLLTTNSDTSGRYHSSWLTMMYSRLFLARQLLQEDGVVFVSIDNAEIHNLRLLMNELFGEENFVGIIIRATGQTTGQDSGGLGSSFDYALVYSRSSEFQIGGIPLSNKDLVRFDNEDDRGKFAYWQMRKTGKADRREDRPNMYFPVYSPDGTEVYPIGPGGYESRWRFGQDTYKKMVKDDYILWKKTKRDGEEVWWPYVKYYLEDRTKRPSSLWTDIDGSKKASRDLRDLFKAKIFDNPKPVSLIERMIRIASEKDTEDIILDFFAGSGTCAEAVLRINRDDGGNRHYIMVQLPEPTSNNSSAKQSGYSTVAEVCKERIRRVIRQMQAEDEGKLPLKNHDLPEDLGFKVFKLAPSNFRAWEGTAKATSAEFASQMELFTDPLVEGWRPANIIYEISLKEGYSLNCYIQRTAVSGHEVYRINDQEKDQHFFLCLEDQITNNIPAALSLTPDDLFVCRDIALDDTMAANLALQCRLKTI